MPRTQGSQWLRAQYSEEWCGSRTISSSGLPGYIPLFLVHALLAPSGRKLWSSVLKEQGEDWGDAGLRQDLLNSMEVSLPRNLDY